MEREYTINGLMILIFLLVMILVTFAFFPGFGTAIKEIADDVFRLPEKKEVNSESHAEKMLTLLADGFEEAKKGQAGCVYDVKADQFSKVYEIKINEGHSKTTITLYEGNEIIKRDERTSIKDITPCIMVNDKKKEDYQSISLRYDKEIELEDTNGNEYKFLDDIPKFYKYGDKHICLITNKVSAYKEEFLKKKDCKTGKPSGEDKAKEFFKDFISFYKKCKTVTGIDACKCGEVDFDMLKAPYNIQALQKGAETTFFLDLTTEKEVIKNNELKELVERWGAILFGNKLKEFDKKREITGKKKLLYYGDRNKIYLAEPKTLSDRELCTKNINPYLKFDLSITKDEYKQKLLNSNVSSKISPYFDYIYDSAKKNDIGMFMIAGVIKAESDWKPKAISSSGAVGLMQIMPGTMNDMMPGANIYDNELLDSKKNIKKGKTGQYVEELKKLSDPESKDDRFVPSKNIQAGVKYLRWIINKLKNEELDPTLENILASYNAGVGKVEKANGVPDLKETKDYVNKICLFYESLNQKVCYTNSI